MGRLADRLVEAIDAELDDNDRLTIGDVENAMQEVMNAICEVACGDGDRNKRFGKNVIPFVQ